MDNDDKKINQSTTDNNSDDYQKILDQAAASVKPEETENIPTTQDTTNELEATAKLEEVNHDINPPQLEAPDEVQSIPSDIPENKPEIINKELPKTDVQSDIEKHELPPVYDPPKENLDTLEEPPKSPEEVKAQIDKILADDSTNTESNNSDSSVAPKKPNSLKTIFIISLIIFFTVAALWVYFLFFYQTSTQSSTSVTPTSVPTKAVVQEVCELNGETYQVGESFASADGCNTCTCQSVGVIACTEMACSLTPTTSISTSSATTSNTPKLSPEKVVQTFYQDYIKTSPLSYKDSPYLTSSLIKSLDETKNKTTNSDPVLYSSIIPDCGVTTNEAVIKNNSATVTVFLCHKNEGKQYLSIDLVLENSQWKINKISP